jgi:glycosyltransferase involved in cell wall biosynthesis
MVLVSVIITCYNYGRFVSQAIESALGQTHPAVEVIVIDDGSTDDTRDVCQRYGNRITYIYQANAGVSCARNRGAAIAKGEFLNFLDADDWLAQNKIEKQLRRFADNPELAVVTCGSHHVDEKGAVLRTVTPCWGNVMLENLLNNVNVCPHAALIRRSVFEAVGGFYEGFISESWPEDVDFFLRVAASGYKFYMEEEALCYYRFHTTTVSRNNQHEASLLGYRRMIDRIAEMQFKTITPAQLKRFRGLVLTGFATRFLRKDLPRSRELILEVWQDLPDLFWNPTVTGNLFLGGIYGPPEIIRTIHIPETWQTCSGLVQEMTGRNTKLGRRLLCSLSLHLGTMAYARNDPHLARVFTHRAILLEPFLVFHDGNLESVIRNYMGPKWGRMAGKVKRAILLAKPAF